MRAISAVAVLATVLTTAVEAAVPVYGQCGGIDYTGDTQCESGTYCQVWSEFYHQCMPNEDAPSTSTTRTSTTTVKTSTSTTSKASTATSSSSSSTLTTSTTTSSSAPPTGTGSPAPSPPSSLTRVRLQPESISSRKIYDSNFKDWVIPEGGAVSTTINGISMTITPNGANFDGAYYKFGYTNPVSHLGEHVLQQGISTESSGKSITLTLKGLSAGTHTLLTYHNSYNTPTNTAKIAVTVNGASAVSGIQQTTRQASFWTAATSYVTFTSTGTSQTITVVYTPSGGEGFAYLNGFEIDTSSIPNQVSFPTPSNNDERVDLAGGSTLKATWTASKASSPKYNIYLGSSPTSMRSVSLGQTGTSATLTGLDTLATWYWRVDVVSGSTTHIGRNFMFRGRQLAFPGAEGWGRWARGGRQGKVVKVTSLADNTSKGTLRYAATVETGPRTIVFDVGGVITLTSRLTVQGDYVTIAGQTAPGKGIVIQGWPLGLSGNKDAIVRHMRVRPGTVSGKTIDGLGGAGVNHAIFDRCSTGWAIDESFSSRGAWNITFQRNMISEPLNVAGHQNYPAGTAHGYAATISGETGSFHHNLIAHAEGRSWSMGGQLDDQNGCRGHLDLRNNVVYNFGGRVTDGSQSRVNFVNNYYKKGPSSGPNYAMKANYELTCAGEERYYCGGNVMPGVFDANSEQFNGDGTGKKDKIACWASYDYSPPPAYKKFYTSQLFEPYVETQSANEAFKRVLSDSGASQPVLDDHDKRIIRETSGGTTTYAGSKSGKKGLIDSPADAGGLESFPTTTRPSTWDADNDGIADWWDGSTGGAGYTELEGYLNFMADPHSYVSPSKSVSIDLAALATGFKSPTFTTSGPTKGTVSVSGTKATYTAGSSAGIDYISIVIKDSEGSTWTRKYGIAIYAGAN